jgi:type IV pilus assembly protein PilB
MGVVAGASALRARPHGILLRGSCLQGYHGSASSGWRTSRGGRATEISREPSTLSYDIPIVAKRIGELLVEAGVLSQSQLEQALFAQRKDGRKLGQLLIELGLVTEVQLTQTLSRQLSVPWVSLYHVDFSRSLLNLVAREAAEKYCLVPIFVRRIRKQGDTLYVAMDDPTNDAAIDDVARAAALPVKPMIACPSDIRAAIRVYYQGEAQPVPTGPTAVRDAPTVRETAPREPPPPPPQVSHAPSPPGPAPVSTAPAPPPMGPRAAPPPPDRPKERPPLPEGAAADPPPVRLRAASIPDASPDSRVPESRGVDRRGQDGRGPDSRPGEDASIPKRMRPRMISLTLLDGTSISIPAPGKKHPSKPDLEAREGASAVPAVSDQLTARDLVSALRAVSHGVDASEILGTEPKWEALFSALLSVLLRKGLIADWEFIEEFRKV